MKTNSEIQKGIINELYADPILKNSASEIGVIVYDGTVTLCGQVNSFAKKTAAENAARRVQGVKVVAINIEVILPGKNRHTDTEIARAVHRALRWHMALEEEQIKVKVEDGWILLEGNVSSLYRKMLAEEALKNLADIKGVVNLIVADTIEEPEAATGKINSSTFDNPTSAINCVIFPGGEAKSELYTVQVKGSDGKGNTEEKETGNERDYSDPEKDIHNIITYKGFKSKDEGIIKTGPGKRKIRGSGNIFPPLPFPKQPPKKRR